MTKTYVATEIECLTDILFDEVTSYKLTKDVSCLDRIALIVAKIRALQFEPSYDKRKEAVVVRRIDAKRSS